MNPVVSDSTAAAATSVVEDTIENARSRRRGTSNACNTCTHRNSAARGMRAASTVWAVRTVRTNRSIATSSPSTSPALITRFDRYRRWYESR